MFQPPAAQMDPRCPEPAVPNFDQSLPESLSLRDVFESTRPARGLILSKDCSNRPVLVTQVHSGLMPGNEEGGRTDLPTSREPDD